MMLMNVAEKFNLIRSLIFQRLKVADKMKEHGVGASTLQTGGLINLKK
jgi:hypothetical protein